MFLSKLTVYQKTKGCLPELSEEFQARVASLDARVRGTRNATAWTFMAIVDVQDAQHVPQIYAAAPPGVLAWGVGHRCNLFQNYLSCFSTI